MGQLGGYPGVQGSRLAGREGLLRDAEAMGSEPAALRCCWKADGAGGAAGHLSGKE